MDSIRLKIQINGIVQGVGFRPFLHREMLSLHLNGWIRNTSEGVEMEIEGRRAQAYALVQRIETSAPVLAVIEDIRIAELEGLAGYDGIDILPSESLRKRDTLISPDVATCPDCMRELFDRGDRRYRYPFINCTNCGPRFSIIRDVPYDRCNTTMGKFSMCPDCTAEYEDIADRRYHAQPDCCADCGPELFYLNGRGEPLAGDPVHLAAEELRRGGIIAVKGLGGIHLACLWNDHELVQKLRARKHRDEKPLAVMFRDTESVRRVCEVSAEEEKLLTGHIRPIVLLRKKNPNEQMHLSDNRCLGVMLPYTPVHHLLLDAVGDALVMTSANLSDLPILIDNDTALDILCGIADGFLLNNRDIENRCDDSLMRIVRGTEYPLRRSRGYAPQPLYMKDGIGNTLACGAEQKASFSLSRGNQVFQSAHIGDLKNAETLAHYEKQIGLFERLFDVKPVRIVCDLHPDYLSTDYARRRAGADGCSCIAVQHHHAHMASCMADNGLEGSCIGVIWDGTGYGTDGTIWGGEFLLGDYSGFVRRGSIRPVKLPGGDRAVQEIWRVGASLMLDDGLEVVGFFAGRNLERIRALLNAGLNCPPSSGMGRLFDGVCAILGIRLDAGYEGQGAVLLEAAADEGCSDAEMIFPFLKEAVWNLFSKPSTVQFPKVNVDAKPNYRGRIAYDPEKCVNCGMCIKVCSPGVITRTSEPVEGGDKITYTFDLTSCTFCSMCADFCSTKAIHLTEDYHMVACDKADLRTVGFRIKAKPAGKLTCGEACVFCGLCARNCPEGAITVDRKEKSWILDESKCVKCGLCMGKCPKKCLSFE